MPETSLDIVICTYNNAALLDRTLAAISRQKVSPGVRQLALELAGRRAGVDLMVAFGPLVGWWTAMWGMFRMDASERRRLVGCAASLPGGRARELPSLVVEEIDGASTR